MAGGGLRERLVRRFLGRDPNEVARAASRFAIGTDAGRQLVSHLGEAFIGGYNAMLELGAPPDVAARGLQIDPHFRPFFFEGAAMGYLPRGYASRGHRPAHAEQDLLEMHAGFRYLYYVGLGFWYGFRHPRNPAKLEALAPHLDPMYMPLCYDGYGFKVGFFDYPRRREVRGLLDRVPQERRSAIYQGFGRSLFFVYMDDPEGFVRERDAAEEPLRDDLELGRSLAVGFTGTDRPASLADHIETASDDSERAARLTGITWALAAREMNDADYFRRCIAKAGDEWRELFLRLPALCRGALEESGSYREWQERTRAAAVSAYRSSRPAGANGETAT